LAFYSSFFSCQCLVNNILSKDNLSRHNEQVSIYLFLAEQQFAVINNYFNVENLVEFK
jgi:hypothetical protein